MSLKKINFVLVLMLCGIVGFSQERVVVNETEQTLEIIKNRNFKVNILSVIRKGPMYIDIYSKSFISVQNEILEAVLPYFYRNDDTAMRSEIKLKTDIHKFNVKNRKELQMLEVNIHIKQPQYYKIDMEIGYDGYCQITVIDHNKNIALYKGHLVLPQKSIDSDKKVNQIR